MNNLERSRYYARIMTNAGTWLDGKWAIWVNGSGEVIYAIDQETERMVPSGSMQYFAEPIGEPA